MSDKKIEEKVLNPVTNEMVIVPAGTKTENINNTYYKELLRKEIKTEVVDELDRIADISNLQSLMFGFIRTIYNVLTVEQKNSITADYKLAMEYAINKYENTNTSADAHWGIEGGLALLDKLFYREQAIGEKVSQYLNKKV